MEKILVWLYPGKTSLWAAVHALNLSKRINARLYFLLVIDPAAKGTDESLMRQIEVSMKSSLESLIEEGIYNRLYIKHPTFKGRIRIHLGVRPKDELENIQFHLKYDLENHFTENEISKEGVQ